MSKLEIGKTYLVSNAFKKSIWEVEVYYNDDKSKPGLNTEVCWRSGSWLITPQNEDEITELESFHIKDPINDDYKEGCLDLSDFEECEMQSTHDGVEERIEYHNGWSDEDKEKLEQEFEDDEEAFGWYDFLTERGYDSHGCENYIYNGVIIEDHEVIN